MKKLLCILSVILAVAMLCPSAVTAADSAEIETADVYAEATTVDGEEVTLADAPDAVEIADLAGYDLIIEDEPVLTVEQTNVPAVSADLNIGGRFTAEFALPDTTKTVLLNGLTADKVEEIQQRIIDNYAQGTDFELQDLSFIDAEKTNPSLANGDVNLCWAATASNLLYYTGWVTQANTAFDTSDDIFESFISAFTDGGGNTFYGLGWFFNGTNAMGLSYSSSAASASAGTGKYISDYAFDAVSDQVDIEGNGIPGMKALYRHLKNGDGVGLGLTVYYRGSYAGGHADSCWGCITDTAYPDTDPAYYAGLFITDSDTDKTFSERRDAPNVMQAVSVTDGTDSNGGLTFEFELDNNNHAFISEFTYLLPYSDALEKETDPNATRDMENTFDVCVSDGYLSTDFDNSHSYYIRDEKIESNTTFFYTPFFENHSNQSFEGTTQISTVITDSNGETVITRSFNGRISIDPMSGLTYGRSLKKNGGLAEGDYTVTMSVNGDKAVTEAFYYNNTFSFPLKVRDSFLLGDVNNNGSIEIMDATAVQRCLAGYGEKDAKTVQRGMVTGGVLNIMDATAIQRRVASFDDGNDIGEKKLYD